MSSPHAFVPTPLNSAEGCGVCWKPKSDPRHVVRPTADFLAHCGMDSPVEGCDCHLCAYGRWFEALSDEERRDELAMIAAYAGEHE